MNCSRRSPPTPDATGPPTWIGLALATALSGSDSCRPPHLAAAPDGLCTAILIDNVPADAAHVHGVPSRAVGATREVR